MGGIRGLIFSLSSAMGPKAGPELHVDVNTCDETRLQTSLTLASSTSRNALETVFLKDQYSGRFSSSLARQRLLMKVATSGGNELCCRWEAAMPRVSCAADVNKSRNDSQLPASATPANNPDLWNSLWNYSTVDLSLSFLM